MKIIRIIAAALVCPGLLVWAMPGQAQTDGYELGLGYQLNPKITLGGYFSAEYSLGENHQAATLDDVAVLAYGNITPSFSFLAEIESVNFYTIDFENDTNSSNTTPAIERLYGDYTFSDQLSVRFGKQITPIGYWNLQPINVLRETTSSPRYSREMFPKFMTGLDFYGFTPFDDTLKYHVYLQGTEDLDDQYINIQIDSHYGVALEKLLGSYWKAGGSIGRFTDINNGTTR